MTQPENTTPGALPQSVAEEDSVQPANEALRRILAEQDEARRQEAEGGQEQSGGEQPQKRTAPTARRTTGDDE